MKRSGIGLADISDQKTLHYAFWRAAGGKRDRFEVRQFVENLPEELHSLSRQILNNSLELGNFHTFEIHDPKPRFISAPSFRERVLHHALMHHIGPVLDRAAVYDSYACRKNKGTIRAVQRAQQHLRRFPWYVQIDISRYFDSIDHEILKSLLERKFKDRGLLSLCGRIIDTYCSSPGQGLPIGALTSQSFANFYLTGLDRFLLEGCKVAGMVRYMDDVVWWCRNKEAAKATLGAARNYLSRQLALDIKPTWRLQRSRCGLKFCGFRILPGTIRLSRRRKRRYIKAVHYWEAAYQQGWIEAHQLQLCYDAVRSITAYADAASFRRSVHAANFSGTENI